MGGRRSTMMVHLFSEWDAVLPGAGNPSHHFGTELTGLYQSQCRAWEWQLERALGLEKSPQPSLLHSSCGQQLSPEPQGSSQ